MSTGRSRTVLVTDTGRGSAVAIIRSLGRKGWRVVAADADRWSPGFRSRYASARVLYPNPVADPEAMIETLLAAVGHHCVDLLIAVTDEVLLPLAQARQRFDALCRLALPPDRAIAVASDKLATLRLAEALGIPTPRMAVVSTPDQSVAAAAGMGWPIVVKPQRSRVYQEGSPTAALAVAYARDEAELATAVARLEGRCDALLQEYWAGEGHGVELLADAGRVVAAFQHRRIREVPLTGGASAFRESVPLDPQLYEYAARLLADLDWTGLAMVEFKVGDGGARLMEMNGRIWGSLPLAVQSGVDFPHRLAALTMGDPDSGVARPPGYRLGVRGHNLELELTWIASVLAKSRRGPVRMPPRRQAFVALADLLDPRTRFDLQSREDPGPGLAELVKIARKPFRKLAARH